MKINATMNFKDFDRLIYNDKFMRYAIQEAIKSKIRIIRIQR